MRSRSPRLATLVPLIRIAYLPSRTGSVTTLKSPVLGTPRHCSVVPVSKSPRQRTSADIGLRSQHVNRNAVTRTKTRGVCICTTFMSSASDQAKASFSGNKIARNLTFGYLEVVVQERKSHLLPRCLPSRHLLSRHTT